MLSNTWDANCICRLLGYTRYSCYQNGKINNILSLKSWQMRRASQDIQGITKRLYKLALFIFLESLKVL